MIDAAGLVDSEGERGSSMLSITGQAAGPGPLAPGQRWSLARKHEVVLRLLRGEPAGPSSASRNRPADAAVRSCWNRGLIRPLTFRNHDAHSSSVASTDPPVIHDPRIMVTDGFRDQSGSQL